MHKIDSIIIEYEKLINNNLYREMRFPLIAFWVIIFFKLSTVALFVRKRAKAAKVNPNRVVIKLCALFMNVYKSIFPVKFPQALIKPISKAIPHS